MPEFTNIGRGFRQRLLGLDGNFIYGRFSELPETAGRGSQFFIPRRVLSVHPSSTIKSGSMVYDAEGNVMLLGYNGADEFRGVYARTFKCFDLDRQLTWARNTTAIDFVTKMPTTTSVQQLGPIWCAQEMMGEVSDMLKETKSRYRLLTSAALQLEDVIGGTMIVRRVEYTLGITFAEIM